MDRSSRQKINKKAFNLNYMLDQMGLTDFIDFYRTSYTTARIYILLRCTWNILQG